MAMKESNAYSYGDHMELCPGGITHGIIYFEKTAMVHLLHLDDETLSEKRMNE